MQPHWHRRAVLAAMVALSARPAIALDPGARTRTDPFALGVASGDPARDGFVLWTRLIGPGLEPLAAAAVAVRYEVAADPAFRTIVATGGAVARPERAHSVHVEVAGLRAGRPFWYRFHALGATSPVGRALTLPVAADHLRLALACCQHWEQARFGAYRDMVAQAPDVVLQVGDYIYEQSYADEPRVRAFGAPEPVDLAGYRRRHALYKTDPDLARAHRACPWIVAWDDHEVLNDYVALANRDAEPPARFAMRRAAAYQAYFEHMPIRPGLWRRPAAPRLYRAFDWADLASLSVLDTRQYRSAPPCQPPGTARNLRTEDCPASASPAATILGARQERWLDARLARESRPWTLIGQQVFFAPLFLDAAHRATFSDQWDGYAANRARLLRGLARENVAGPVVLSGDVHSFWVNDLDDADGHAVAGEVVASALGAGSPPAGRFGDAMTNNRHVHFSDVVSAGYVMLDIDRTRLRADLRAIADRRCAGSPVASLAAFVMERGTRRLIRA